MKPAVVTTVLLTLAGAASVGWLVSPRDSLRSTATDAARPGVAAIAQTGRPPVPYVPSAKAPVAAQLASLPEPTQDLSQLTMQPENSAKLAIERDAHKYVHDLMSSDGPCRGRLPRSIIIEGNGKVSARCCDPQQG